MFTLTLQANGDYTLDLDDQVDHDPASGDAAILAIDLSGSVVAVDADADPVDLTGEFLIQIENDVPIALSYLPPPLTPSNATSTSSPPTPHPTPFTVPRVSTPTLSCQYTAPHPYDISRYAPP